MVDVFADDPDSEWSVWGDTHTRTWYSSWSLLPGGVRYPRTWTVERNGLPLQKTSVIRVDLRPAATDSFAIPDAVRAKFATSSAPTTLGNGRGSPIELTEGVTYLPGRWGVLLVRQPSGVVVVDAPLSADYSSRVFDEVAHRYPSSSVSAVVLSDFMWVHLGGMREYVARGVPVYANDRNEVLLRQIVAAPHRTHPDSLALAAKPLAFRGVKGVQQIGTGSNRIQLLSVGVVGADYGRRVVLTYLPERHLLYASDLYSPRGEANFASQGASELVEIVRAFGLVVETVVGSHLAPTPWATIATTITNP